MHLFCIILFKTIQSFTLGDHGVVQTKQQPHRRRLRRSVELERGGGSFEREPLGGGETYGGRL